MSKELNSGAIPIEVPVVDLQTGRMTPVWWRFLMTILARTGGNVGTLSVDLLESMAEEFINDPSSASSVTVVSDFLSAMLAQDVADVPVSEADIRALMLDDVPAEPQGDAGLQVFLYADV